MPGRSGLRRRRGGSQPSWVELEGLRCGEGSQGLPASLVCVPGHKVGASAGRGALRARPCRMNSGLGVRYFLPVYLGFLIREMEGRMSGRIGGGSAAPRRDPWPTPLVRRALAPGVGGPRGLGGLGQKARLLLNAEWQAPLRPWKVWAELVFSENTSSCSLHLRLRVLVIERLLWGSVPTPRGGKSCLCLSTPGRFLGVERPSREPETRAGRCVFRPPTAALRAAEAAAARCWTEPGFPLDPVPGCSVGGPQPQVMPCVETWFLPLRLRSVLWKLGRWGERLRANLPPACRCLSVPSSV